MPKAFVNIPCFLRMLMCKYLLHSPGSTSRRNIVCLSIENLRCNGQEQYVPIETWWLYRWFQQVRICDCRELGEACYGCVCCLDCIYYHCTTATATDHLSRTPTMWHTPSLMSTWQHYPGCGTAMISSNSYLGKSQFWGNVVQCRG